MFPFSRDPKDPQPAVEAPAPRPTEAHPLDALTGGVFSAATSGERAQRVRDWLATEPTPEHMQEVFKELSSKDKGAAKALREKLKATAEIRGPEIVSQDISTDGTRKWVVRVASGSCVETVYIPQGGRGTLCVSSQAGCALDCSFCSTGKQGFNSDLTSAEIIGQVWIANKSCGSVPAKVDRAITNVVMMGMGEPLQNYTEIIWNVY